MPKLVRGLRPFFGYYGGKWRDTPRLYPTPTYPTLVEPFAGSAGYSLRYYTRDVVLVEADPRIRGIWKYLISADPDHVRALPDILPEQHVEELGVSEVERDLIGMWLNRGVASPRKRPSKWMRSGIRPGSFWGPRVRDTIASQVESIRHWRVLDGTYEVTTDLGPATWFIDPPYTVAGKSYRYGPGKVDYQALGRWCRARQGQVIVCENEGADWLPFEPLQCTKTTRRGRRSQEVAWIRP